VDGNLPHPDADAHAPSPASPSAPPEQLAPPSPPPARELLRRCSRHLDGNLPPQIGSAALRQTAPFLSTLGRHAIGTVESIRPGVRAGAAAGKPSFVPPSRPPSFPTTRPFPSLSPASSRAPAGAARSSRPTTHPRAPPSSEHHLDGNLPPQIGSAALRQTVPFLSTLGRHAICTVESIRPGVRAGDCGREKPSSVPPARPPNLPPTRPLPFPPPSGPAPCRGISRLSPALRPGSCPPLAPAGAAQTQVRVPVTAVDPYPALRATPRLRAAPLHKVLYVEPGTGNNPGLPKTRMPEGYRLHRAGPAPASLARQIGSAALRQTAEFILVPAHPPLGAASWRAAREPPDGVSCSSAPAAAPPGRPLPPGPSCSRRTYQPSVPSQMYAPVVPGQ
jgi:hypothetical protein